jgi:hypothetical protein
VCGRRSTATFAPSDQVLWLSGDGNADDISGNSNNGSLNNGATYKVGKVGQSFEFDGNNDDVSIPNSPSLNFGSNQPMSVEFWAYRSSNSGLQHLIGRRNNCDGSPINFQFVYIPNQVIFGAGFGNEVSSGQDLPLNTWTHIIGTFDGTTFRIYMNGVLTATASGSLGATSAPLILGGSGTCPKFGGKLDEVSIYNRALTQDEISSIFNAGIGGKLKPSVTANFNFMDLISVWHAENNANDSNGTNNGTLQNGATFIGGKIGQSFDFDGVNDYISIPDSPSLRPATALTAQGWFKFDSIVGGTANHLISKPYGSSFGNSYVMWIQDGRIWIGVCDSPTNCTFADTGYVVQLGVWYHIAMTFDDAANSMKCYVNGAEVGSFTTNITIAYDNHPLLIGGELTNEIPGFFQDGQADEVSIYSRALTATEIQAIALTEKIGDATLTFQTIATGGTAQEIPLDLTLFPALPNGATSVGLTYDIATSAIFSGNVQVCFNLPSLPNPQFANLRVYHLENGAWVNRTASGNTFPTLCTSGVTSLSPFAIAEFVPNAAQVSVSGKVTNSFGNGIRNAKVQMTDSSGNVRTISTNAFGYYRFEGVNVGETYVFEIRSKQFQFQPQVVNVTDNIMDLNFTAMP